MFCTFPLSAKEEEPVRRLSPEEIGTLAQEIQDVGDYKRLPEAITKTWTDAGTRYGWFYKNHVGQHLFQDEQLSSSLPASDAKLSALPAFHILSQLGSDGLAKLPAPESPFGMVLPSYENLQHLARFENLTWLVLHNGHAGRDRAIMDLKHLSGLKNLKGLSLSSYIGLTDADMQHLAGLENLRELYLSSTLITDAGLKHLAALNKLERLTFSDLNDITDSGPDAGLKHLAGLTNLKWLSLGRSSGISNSDHFLGLKSLRYLDISETSVRWARVQDALPNCLIREN
jgi:Leucine-rich repeat (LRR) protein